MRVIVIEDEAVAYKNIKNLLYQAEPTIEIINNFDTVADSVAWFRSNPAPDLVFMDIELADGLSFNIFECVTIDAPIIFTTAYDEHAIKAFRVNSIDYILKPITLKSIREALNKFEKMNRLSLRQISRNMEQLLVPKAYLQRILIPVKDKIIPIRIDEIAYFYNTSGSTKLATIQNIMYGLEKSLDTIMSKLVPSKFFRANRQFIISKEMVDSITVWFDNRLLIRLHIDTPEPIYISKNKVSEFKQWFAEGIAEDTTF